MKFLLQSPVVFKGKNWTLKEYQETFIQEQEGSCLGLSQEIDWKIPASLQLKVDEKGKLKAFFGDTTVIKLREQKDLDFFSSLQKSLHQHLGDCLASPLHSETFHMTTHDLSNGPQLQALQSNMKENEKRLRPFLTELRSFLRENPQEGPLRMRCTNLYPCLNISILAALVPADEESFKKLAAIYNFVDKISYLDYWPRFHITMAYFFPRKMTASESLLIGKTLQQYNPINYEFELNLSELVYQYFIDMNSYRDQL